MPVDTTTQVVMPQMGDSVAEGTILEWHKHEGERVEADETLVEISTDKVDAEVPAGVAGTVVRILAAEGDTVAVGSVLAEIAPADDAAANGDSPHGAAANGAGAAPPPAAGQGDGAPGAGQTLEIVMPQMGESVTEGVVLEWHKAAGEPIAADETLVEISTDKVDAEVPAPAAGTVTELLVEPGDTVTVGQVLARMQATNGASAAASAGTVAPPPPAEAPSAPAPAAPEPAG
ncbi:MAG TPA: biotin/lipoyl-containing protein, partial [Conexibacter sp.]|nr:biotin/lipoyl-containing protein [Conexibacter sp.]